MRYLIKNWIFIGQKTYDICIISFLISLHDLWFAIFINKQQYRRWTKLSLSCESRVLLFRVTANARRTNRILQNVCFLLRETDLQWKSRECPMFEMARSSEIYFQSGTIEYAFLSKPADARNTRSFFARNGIKSNTRIMTQHHAKIGVIMVIAFSKISAIWVA